MAPCIILFKTIASSLLVVEWCEGRIKRGMVGQGGGGIAKFFIRLIWVHEKQNAKTRVDQSKVAETIC